MNEIEFKIGHVVQLKSGGPSFVLTHVSPQSPVANGTYYNPITGLVVGCTVPLAAIRHVSDGGKK